MTLSVEALNAYLIQRVPAQQNVGFGWAPHTRVGGADRYLFNTPEALFERRRNLPDWHSPKLPKMISEVIGAATTWVDIVTMDMPTGDNEGEFLQAVIHGICEVRRNNTGTPVTIRILVGSSPPHANYHTGSLLGRIRDALNKVPMRTGGLSPEVYIAQMRFQEASAWNHAKIVATDGKVILTGGHNLWSDDYLRMARAKPTPVLDLTMRYDGPIARGGHQFADVLWRFVKKHNTHNGSARTYSNSIHWVNRAYVFGNEAPDVYWEGRHPSNDGPGQMPALWVTNPGFGVYAEGRVGLEGTGLISLIRALKEGRYCRIVQQDLGSRWGYHEGFHVERPVDYPYHLIAHKNYWFNLPLMDNIADFLWRSGDHKLDLVLSTPGAGSYNNDIPPEVIFNVIGQRMATNYGASKAQVLARFGSQVRIGTAGLSPQMNTWGNGDLLRMHAKFWMVDELCYVGSENLYPSVVAGFNWTGSLQEFGIIVDADAAFKQMILDQYFAPLLSNRINVEIKEAHLTW